MKEEQFTLEEQVFRFEKEETSWRLDLKRSEVDSQDLRNLWILDLHHPLFLEQSMTADQDQIHLTYQTDALGLSAEEIQAITGFRPSASSYQCLGFGASLGASGDLYVASHQFVCDQGCASQDRLSRGAGDDGATQVGSG